MAPDDPEASKIIEHQHPQITSAPSSYDLSKDPNMSPASINPLSKIKITPPDPSSKDEKPTLTIDTTGSGANGTGGLSPPPPSPEDVESRARWSEEKQ
ncbi:MAG: hypothetical protein Q9222_004745 [Ikaeria aurantiellina]